MEDHFVLSRSCKGRKIFLALLLSLIASSEIKAQGTWTQKANFAGPPRFVAACFSIGTKGYIGTGRDGSAAATCNLHYSPLPILTSHF